ncbi:alanine:cation symporter family protein [Rickettsiales bacterium]|nr:alanine:cation symporter family protein [Rickettsiales bacterium]
MEAIFRRKKLFFSILSLLAVTFFYNKVLATSGVPSIADSSVIINLSREFIETVVSFLGGILFYKIAGFPLLVLWLVIGGLFFTIRMGFVNIRMFKHAIDVVRGKYSSGNEPGEVSHFQALTAAVSATVGLGNIAGVAVAVSIGGPGAVIWMMLAGFLGMSTKFAEVTLGQKYRRIDKKGKVSGGAFYYLRDGLKEKGFPKLGKILAATFAVFCVLGSLGAGNMFQSSQTVSMLTSSFDTFGELDILISMILAVSVGMVLIGGIKRIAIVAEAIVPLMAFIYITAAIVVIAVNYQKVPAAIMFMFEDAFTGIAVGGGMIGAIINGFKRAAFSNEAGLGSAPIAHSAAKTQEPVREGIVALLEPFIDTIIICFITGLVITVTGVYADNADGAVSGVLLTSNAFSTVVDWFPKVLSVAVVLFAYSTMITWSYYGERCWSYLFGRKMIVLYQIIFCFGVFIGGVVGDISLIVDFSDLLILSMAIPNLIGVYMLSGDIRRSLDEYVEKLKDKKFQLYN